LVRAPFFTTQTGISLHGILPRMRSTLLNSPFEAAAGPESAMFVRQRMAMIPPQVATGTAFRLYLKVKEHPFPCRRCTHPAWSRWRLNVASRRWTALDSWIGIGDLICYRHKTGRRLLSYPLVMTDTSISSVAFRHTQIIQMTTKGVLTRRSDKCLIVFAWTRLVTRASVGSKMP